MPSIERDGARVSYEITGDGPVVLLGHSLLCDGRMWDKVVPTLSERFRVINVDFRGHRHSTAPRPFSLDDLARDWLAVLDAEQVSRAALCGLSMGGMTALRVALRAPERVAGMALIDSNGAREGRFNRIKYSIMAAMYRRTGYSAVLERAVKKLMFGRSTLRQRPELVAELRDMVRGHDREQLTRAIVAVFRRDSVLEQLHRIECPALILVGAEDLATPPDRSEALHAGLKSSSLEVLPRAGHLSAMEQPERVAAAVAGFLDGLDLVSSAA